MTERPILFSAPMVRALLDGRKTQTRRVVKPPAPEGAVDAGVISSGSDSNGLWWWLDSKELEWASPIGDEFRCPYGVPGDRLWVRESCRAEELSRPPTTRTATRKERQAFGRTTVVELDELDGCDGVRYPADDAWRKIENSREAADRWFDLLHYGKKPPSKGLGALVPAIHMPRWASRITLRIADVRVERLNEISEADARAEGFPITHDGKGYDPPPPEVDSWQGYGRASFCLYWSEINGPGSWAANPWVWVVEFERAVPNPARDAALKQMGVA